MIFDFQDPTEIAPERLRTGLLALQELVPWSYSAKCEEALDFCADRMGRYLDVDIESTFSDPEVQNSVRACAYTVPLARKVIDRLSLLYKRDPKRRLIVRGDSTRDESAGRLYHEIAFQGGLSDALRSAHRMANLLGLSFVQVGASGSRIVFDVLSGKDVLLSPPADGRVSSVEDYDALVLPKPYTVDGARVYAFWSARFHFLFDENGCIVDDFGDPELGNPLGAIPLIRLDREGSGELYPLPPESLVRANRQLNFAMTELFYTKKFQSFGQPVFVSDDDIQPDLKVGVQHLVHVVRRDAAASGDFRFESPDAPIREVKESVFDFLRLAARLHDVSPQSVDVSTVVESGVSKLVSERDSLEARERDTRLLRRVEGRIFELVCALTSHYRAFEGGPAARYGSDLALLDASKLALQVDYPEEAPSLDPADRLELQERELELGLKSIVDIYRERNPDAAGWSEAQVLETLRANAELNTQLR